MMLARSVDNGSGCVNSSMSIQCLRRNDCGRPHRSKARPFRPTEAWILSCALSLDAPDVILRWLAQTERSGAVGVNFGSHCHI